jgi:hypothetical protein
MSDIFISYSRKDRNKAKPIAEALEKLGWSVWWDIIIPAGKTFPQVISEALADAQCIVVLWSKNAIVSNWVLDEAEEGLEKKTLVPVFIEKDVQPPLGFRRIQAADLINWDGNKKAQEFEKLVADISMIIGQPPAAEKEKRRGADEEAKHIAQQRRLHEKEEKQTETPGKEKEKHTDFSNQDKQPPTEKKADIKQSKTGWIVGLSALCLSILAIIVFRFIPHLTNNNSLPTTNEPGVYLDTNAIAGAKLDDSMVTLVQFEEGVGTKPDLPLYYSDIEGWCLLIDVKKGQKITWDDIGACLE